MRIGLQVPNFSIPNGAAGLRSHLAHIAKTADAGGFYSLWVMDHYFQIRNVGQPEEDMLEAYTTLAYFAALTEKVKLGTMVTGVIYRYPALLVKIVSTLDVLSGGRAYLGIGAAWNEQESKGLGVPFPSTKERFELLEEALQIAHQMWDEKIAPYEGKHNQLAQTMNHPQPITRPHPPILIGGTGENKTMRLIAKYGDGCNFFAGMGMDTVKQKLAILKQRCDEVNRPYDQIEKTVLDSVNLTDLKINDLVARVSELKALGVQHYIINSPQMTEPDGIDRLVSDVVPAIAAI